MNDCRNLLIAKTKKPVGNGQDLKGSSVGKLLDTVMYPTLDPDQVGYYIVHPSIPVVLPGACLLADVATGCDLICLGCGLSFA